MMEPAMTHPLDFIQGKAKEKREKQRKWADRWCLPLPQPQPTRAQFVVLAGEQALNKQEELKLAEQSEKYLELFMYEWLQGGKDRQLFG